MAKFLSLTMRASFDAAKGADAAAVVAKTSSKVTGKASDAGKVASGMARGSKFIADTAVTVQKSVAQVKKVLKGLGETNASKVEYEPKFLVEWGQSIKNSVNSKYIKENIRNNEASKAVDRAFNKLQRPGNGGGYTGGVNKI